MAIVRLGAMANIDAVRGEHGPRRITIAGFNNSGPVYVTVFPAPCVGAEVSQESFTRQWLMLSASVVETIQPITVGSSLELGGDRGRAPGTLEIREAALSIQASRVKPARGNSNGLCTSGFCGPAGSN
jgi:hypothetical protein